MDFYSQLSRRGMPDEQRAPMPVQDLRQFAQQQVRPPVNAKAVRSACWRRIFVLGGALAISITAIYEMKLVLGIGGLTSLEYLVLVLFALTFSWITIAFVSSIAGFFRVIRRIYRKPDFGDSPLSTHTAVLMPTYNEDPARVFAAIESMAQEVSDLGESRNFDWFVISDTTDAAIARQEQQALMFIRQRLGTTSRIYYRRRRDNKARKSGNVQDFCIRWGARYEHLLVLDADSFMSGRVIIEMARRMENNPDQGLLQTVPRLINGTTLIARLQQFAGRVYGPVVGSGLSWWVDKDGNFWGHNAIIRTCAFMESAGLPELSGKPPFGGHILSHDFVEAALIRRAGWSVEIADDLVESYEESPSSIIDLAIRDRRWCQGNLQHCRIVTAKGLHWVSRIHFMTGIMSYLSSPLWLLLIIAGLMLSLQYQFVRPEYFPPGFALFPNWPLMDPQRALRLFVVTMAILFGPKFLGLLSFLLDGQQRKLAGGGIRILLSFVAEVIVSALVAPIMMLIHSGAVFSILVGKDSGWAPQRRDDGRVPWKALCYRHRWHVLGGVILTISSYIISLDVLAWLSPAIIGMVLAVPLSYLTGSNRFGQKLKKIGILRIPEEQELPDVVRQAHRVFPLYRDNLGSTPSLAEIAADPIQLKLHLLLSDQTEVRKAGQIEAIDAIAAIKIADAANIEQAVSFLTTKEQSRVQNTPTLMKALGALSDSTIREYF
ncbi:MAG: Glucans biosynthesis glucosyltransferase H [Candidatus Celerinatantimonas neptuna]|nr:MAG: Glucans biosynthesis glucosyltransferase H [Candidatus Celerinatantimonas neptuna]